MDRISQEARSALMSRIRSKHTRPELCVRSLLHRLGFRFRLHKQDLPGCPDIVLPKYRAVIFVHGCFWHGHACRFGSAPKSNVEFWSNKLQNNRTRDQRNVAALNDMGWEVLEVWECEIRHLEALEVLLTKFLKCSDQRLISAAREKRTA